MNICFHCGMVMAVYLKDISKLGLTKINEKFLIDDDEDDKLYKYFESQEIPHCCRIYLTGYIASGDERFKSSGSTY